MRYYFLMEIFIEDLLKMARFMAKVNISTKMELYTKEIFILDLFGEYVEYHTVKEKFWKNMKENSVRDRITVLELYILPME